MHRFILRALLMGLIAGALVMGPGPAALVFADDEPPTEGDAEAPEGIQWVEGWAAGSAQARKDGRLIFLYFGRTSPR